MIAPMGWSKQGPVLREYMLATSYSQMGDPREVEGVYNFHRFACAAKSCICVGTCDITCARPSIQAIWECEGSNPLSHRSTITRRHAI